MRISRAKSFYYSSTRVQHQIAMPTVPVNRTLGVEYTCSYLLFHFMTKMSGLIFKVLLFVRTFQRFEIIDYVSDLSYNTYSYVCTTKKNNVAEINTLFPPCRTRHCIGIALYYRENLLGHDYQELSVTCHCHENHKISSLRL